MSRDTTKRNEFLAEEDREDLGPARRFAMAVAAVLLGAGGSLLAQPILRVGSWRLEVLGWAAPLPIALGIAVGIVLGLVAASRSSRVFQVAAACPWIAGVALLLLAQGPHSVLPMADSLRPGSPAMSAAWRVAAAWAAVGLGVGGTATLLARAHADAVGDPAKGLLATAGWIIVGAASGLALLGWLIGDFGLPGAVAPGLACWALAGLVLVPCAIEWETPGPCRPLDAGWPRVAAIGVGAGLLGAVPILVGAHAVSAFFPGHAATAAQWHGAGALALSLGLGLLAGGRALRFIKRPFPVLLVVGPAAGIAAAMAMATLPAFAPDAAERGTLVDAWMRALAMFVPVGLVAGVAAAASAALLPRSRASAPAASTACAIAVLALASVGAGAQRGSDAAKSGLLPPSLLRLAEESAAGGPVRIVDGMRSELLQRERLGMLRRSAGPDGAVGIALDLDALEMGRLRAILATIQTEFVEASVWMDPFASPSQALVLGRLAPAAFGSEGLDAGHSRFLVLDAAGVSLASAGATASTLVHPNLEFSPPVSAQPGSTALALWAVATEPRPVDEDDPRERPPWAREANAHRRAAEAYLQALAAQRAGDYAGSARLLAAARASSPAPIPELDAAIEFPALRARVVAGLAHADEADAAPWPDAARDASRLLAAYRVIGRAPEALALASPFLAQAEQTTRDHPAERIAASAALMREAALAFAEGDAHERAASLIRQAAALTAEE